MPDKKFSIAFICLLNLISCVTPRSSSSSKIDPFAPGNYPIEGVCIEDYYLILSTLAKVVHKDDACSILSISTLKPNSATVEIGMIGGPRAGQGQIYTLKKTNGVWVVEGIKSWVS